MQSSNLFRKLTASVAIFIFLAVCLGITTFALIYSIVTVEDNIFTTGFVDIDLNGGEPVIDAPDIFLEPGMTIERDFYVKNTGSIPIYFRLYFTGVAGELADLVEIKITDGSDVIYNGNATKISDAKALEPDEERTLKIEFYLPTDKGDTAQNKDFRFNLCADAVQSQNQDPTNIEFSNN